MPTALSLAGAAMSAVRAALSWEAAANAAVVTAEAALGAAQRDAGGAKKNAGTSLLAARRAIVALGVEMKMLVEPVSSADFNAFFRSSYSVLEGANIPEAWRDACAVKPNKILPLGELATARNEVCVFLGRVNQAHTRALEPKQASKVGAAAGAGCDAERQISRGAMPAKRARNSSGVGGGGAAADGCKRAGACGGAYGGGADSCSLCFYCFAAAKSLRCCPACPAAHCGKPACERKYAAHCEGGALNSEALLAYLVKLREHASLLCN